MAALYGRLRGNRGETTRVGHDYIRSTLETWSGQVKSTLARDGDFDIAIGPKGEIGKVVIAGNVDRRTISLPGLIKATKTSEVRPAAVLTFENFEDRDAFLALVNGETR